MIMQYIIIGILIALAVAFMARWYWRKFRGVCNCGCNSGGGSSKKIKPTRASLTIGGKEINRSSH